MGAIAVLDVDQDDYGSLENLAEIEQRKAIAESH